jgi:hypothetical protein
MCWNSKTKTSFGLKINDNKVPGLPTKETYERALVLFVEECAKKFDEVKVRQALSSVTVEWWDKIAPRPSTGEINTVVVDNNMVYSGLTVGTLCKVAWRGKLWRSAFCHELLHIIGRALLGSDDPMHVNNLLWKELEPATNLRLSAEQL